MRKEGLSIDDVCLGVEGHRISVDTDGPGELFFSLFFFFQPTDEFVKNFKKVWAELPP